MVRLLRQSSVIKSCHIFNIAIPVIYNESGVRVEGGHLKSMGLFKVKLKLNLNQKRSWPIPRQLWSASTLRKVGFTENLVHFVCVCVHVCVHACMRACVCAHVHVCMCTCVHACVRVCGSICKFCLRFKLKTNQIFFCFWSSFGLGWVWWKFIS